MIFDWMRSCALIYSTNVIKAEMYYEMSKQNTFGYSEILMDFIINWNSSCKIKESAKWILCHCNILLEIDSATKKNAICFKVQTKHTLVQLVVMLIQHQWHQLIPICIRSKDTGLLLHKIKINFHYHNVFCSICATFLEKMVCGPYTK